jgi:hypothetical protein
MLRRLLVPLALFLALSTGGCKLTWAPPALEAPLNINIGTGGGSYNVPDNWDCRVNMPSVPVTGRVKIRGCRNLVMIGGQIEIPGPPNGKPEEAGLYLTDYTDTVHVEGVELGGKGLTNGLWLSTRYPGTIAQVENVLVREVHAKVESTEPDGWTEEHPDLIQLWQGPSVLRVDRFSGTAAYQGIVPDSAVYSNPRNTSVYVDIRNTNVKLTGTGVSCYAVFQTPLYSAPMTSLQNVFCDPGARPWNAALVPSPSSNPGWWGDVQRTPQGLPQFVDSQKVGLGYESPGYEP